MSENKSKAVDEKNGKVIVEKNGDEWVVRNQGDSAILFSAHDKEPAVDFANDMVEKHEVELEIRDEEESHDDESQVPSVKDLVVSKNDGLWEVSHEGDTAVLFSAHDKEAAMKFARDMAEEHGIRVKE